MEQKSRVVALAGNPNVGKSTLFNALTGLRQHTGNWPGKTVELAQGQCGELLLVDLPGTYSLSPGSPEEAVTDSFLHGGEAEAVIVVCDATCLQRSLVLALQILARAERVLVAVNLLDEADRRNVSVDLPQLERRLGVPVCGLSAGRGEGVDHLLARLRAVLDGFERLHPLAVPGQPREVVRLAEDISAACTSGSGQLRSRRELILDRALTGPLGVPLLLALLLGVFWLTIWGANIPSALLQRGFDWLGGWLHRGAAALGLPWWLSGALLDGVYATAARVVAVMLPPMAIFFPLFTLLEDLGYLPRAAFLMDSAFARCGACGKQALTMAMGFGCNAAGVVGCRIIDSPRERLLAILTNSMVPCNGRFPALISLIVLFFAGQGAGSSLLAAGMLTLLVALGVGATLAASFGLSRTLLRGTPSAYAMELPPFRRPRVGQILLRSLLDRTGHVLSRAAVVAAPAGLVLWLLANLAPGGTPLLARLAAALEPIGRYLGMNGAILTGFLLGFPANELVMPVVVMLLTSSGTLAGAETAELAALLPAAGWTRATALCTMLFFLFHWPCSTTCLTIRRETHSWRWTAAAVLLPTVIGAVLCRLTALLA